MGQRPKGINYPVPIVSAIIPFCCQQQTQELGRVGFVFICTVEEGEPKAALNETREPCWVTLDELRRLLVQTPERFFTFHLAALNYYLNNTGSHKDE